ncbi:hypothetical protein BJ742DRAFT_812848 [Cladochytrium replicatum]|nr:hypothetical protein BJ742DRAFT_812848 [Cladochytrium replicatum]
MLAFAFCSSVAVFYVCLHFRRVCTGHMPLLPCCYACDSVFHYELPGALCLCATPPIRGDIAYCCKTDLFALQHLQTEELD